MTGPAPGALPEQIADATRRMTEWLCALPEWPTHPVNASRSVSAHYGPTILSEHDCVMHYARFLSQAGVAWEDMHLELSPGQWMYETTGASPKRIDLAVVAPGRCRCRAARTRRRAAARRRLRVRPGQQLLEVRRRLPSRHASQDRPGRGQGRPSTCAPAWPRAGTSWSSRSATTACRPPTPPMPRWAASTCCSCSSGAGPDRAAACQTAVDRVDYRAVDEVTPNEIARTLGVTGLTFRNWLRSEKVAGHPLLAGHAYRTRYHFTRREADQLTTEYRASGGRPRAPEQPYRGTAKGKEGPAYASPSRQAREKPASRSPPRADRGPAVTRSRDDPDVPDDAMAGLVLSDEPGHRLTETWMGRETLTLADLLRPGLRAVVVGINPSPVSVAAGHYSRASSASGSSSGWMRPGSSTCQPPVSRTTPPTPPGSGSPTS